MLRATIAPVDEQGLSRVSDQTNRAICTGKACTLQYRQPRRPPSSLQNASSFWTFRRGGTRRWWVLACKCGSINDLWVRFVGSSKKCFREGVLFIILAHHHALIRTCFGLPHTPAVTIASLLQAATTWDSGTAVKSAAGRRGSGCKLRKLVVELFQLAIKGQHTLARVLRRTQLATVLAFVGKLAQPLSEATGVFAEATGVLTKATGVLAKTNWARQPTFRTSLCHRLGAHLL